MGVPIALYLLALAVRLVLIAGFPHPAYPDSFYYVEVARSLAAGRGFVIDAVWIEEVATAYDIRWLVLNRADTVAAVAPILDGTTRPPWIGPPVAHRPARQPDGAPPLPEGALDVAVFPVCSAPNDPRCANPDQ